MTSLKPADRNTSEESATIGAPCSAWSDKRNAIEQNIPSNGGAVSYV